MKTGSNFSITIRLKYSNQPGMLGKITLEIGKIGGDVIGVDVVSMTKGLITRDFTINTSSEEHMDRVVRAISALEGVETQSISDATFLMHLGGKISVTSRQPLKTREDLSKAYTPGVARVSKAIEGNPAAVWNLTAKANTVAVVTDGTAVLGLGNIGAEASLPVMEGKAMLFKEFAGINAWPIALSTTDTEAIIETVKNIAPGFGGINLEDISSPRCYEIEERLENELDIPVFHDDQHGTAVVVLAGLINALKVVDKSKEQVKIVILGMGAAGSAITKILVKYGFANIFGFDKGGVLRRDFTYKDPSKEWISKHTNPNCTTVVLEECLKGADVFIGVSKANLLTPKAAAAMSSDAIIFALANPTPEIDPLQVPENVAIVATGRSDFPNQINNVLCFPGLFKGLLEVRASHVTDEIKFAAAKALAETIPENHLGREFIMPSVFDKMVVKNISSAVAKVAVETGIARKTKKFKASSSHEYHSHN